MLAETVSRAWEPLLQVGGCSVPHSGVPSATPQSQIIWNHLLAAITQSGTGVRGSASKAACVTWSGFPGLLYTRSSAQSLLLSETMKPVG